MYYGTDFQYASQQYQQSQYSYPTSLHMVNLKELTVTLVAQNGMNFIS